MVGDAWRRRCAITFLCLRKQNNFNVEYIFRTFWITIGSNCSCVCFASEWGVSNLEFRWYREADTFCSGLSILCNSIWLLTRDFDSMNVNHCVGVKTISFCECGVVAALEGGYAEQKRRWTSWAIRLLLFKIFIYLFNFERFILWKQSSQFRIPSNWLHCWLYNM